MSEPTAAPPPCVTPRDDAGLFLDARRPRIAPWTSIYTRKNQTHRPRIRAARLITSLLNPETDNTNTGGRQRSDAQTRGIRGAQRPDTRRKTRIDRAEPARTHRQQARKEPGPMQMHKQAHKTSLISWKTNRPGSAQQRDAAQSHGTVAQRAALTREQPGSEDRTEERSGGEGHRDGIVKNHVAYNRKYLLQTEHTQQRREPVRQQEELAAQQEPVSERACLRGKGVHRERGRTRPVVQYEFD
jgi:hypothetical protein